MSPLIKTHSNASRCYTKRIPMPSPLNKVQANALSVDENVGLCPLPSAMLDVHLLRHLHNIITTEIIAIIIRGVIIILIVSPLKLIFPLKF